MLCNCFGACFFFVCLVVGVFWARVCACACVCVCVCVSASVRVCLFAWTRVCAFMSFVCFFICLVCMFVCLSLCLCVYTIVLKIDCWQTRFIHFHPDLCSPNRCSTYLLPWSLLSPISILIESTLNEITRNLLSSSLLLRRFIVSEFYVYRDLLSPSIAICVPKLDNPCDS